MSTHTHKFQGGDYCCGIAMTTHTSLKVKIVIATNGHHPPTVKIYTYENAASGRHSFHAYCAAWGECACALII